MTRPWLALTALAGALLAGGPAAAEGPPTRAAAEAALARLATTSPAARAVWRAGVATPALVTGLDEPAAGADAPARASAFLAAWPALVATSRAGLRVRETTGSRDRTVVRFEQVHEGLRVLDREVAVTLDAGGRVLTLVDDSVPLAPLAPARISAPEARDRALRAVGLAPEDLPADRLAGTPVEEVVLAHPGTTRRVLSVVVVREPLRQHLRVLVDAATGEVVDIRNLALH